MLLFGADPAGSRDSAGAFARAIAFAQRTHPKVYIPPGRYQADRHIIVDHVTIHASAGRSATVAQAYAEPR